MSTIQQELEQLGDNPSLSDLQSAIGRIQSDLGTNRDKIRAAERFLGAAAEQLDLPGLYTLPNGNRFVPAGETRSRSSTGVDDARYLARVGLLPDGARERIEQNFSWNDDFEPLPGTETDVANRPPRTERRLQSTGSLTNVNLADVRNGPYVDIERSGEAVRVYADADRLAQFADRYGYTEDDIVDPNAPQDEPEASADGEEGATATPTDGADTPGEVAASAGEIYPDLASFAASDLGGLRNDRDQEPAIRELQTFLSDELGLDTGGVDGRYGPRTTEAVRRFQDAVTGVTVDGDAGPETVSKIQEIRTDMERMQELISRMEESAVPFAFKSSLARILQEDLTQDEREELQQLVQKYEGFREVFPDFRQENFNRAQEFITSVPSSGNSDNLQGRRNPTTATNPEALDNVTNPEPETIQQALGEPVDVPEPTPGQTSNTGIRNPITYGNPPTLVNGVPQIVNQSLQIVGSSLTSRNAQAFRDTLNYDILTQDMARSIVRELDRLYPLTDISDAILGNDISEDERQAFHILLNTRIELSEITRTEYQPPEAQQTGAGTGTEDPTTTIDSERGSRLFGDSKEIISLAKKLLER